MAYYISGEKSKRRNGHSSISRVLSGVVGKEEASWMILHTGLGGGGYKAPIAPRI